MSLSLKALFEPSVQLRAAVLAGLLLGSSFVTVTLLRWPTGSWLAWASLAVGMLYGGKAAWDALSQRTFDIDVLMAVGALLAAYIGHPAEGALLLFLFVLSGALEDLAQERTQREISSLSKLLPSDALVFRDGDWRLADATPLAAGDRIKVRPGERVPTDASVALGESSFDQSAITGEAIPRHVKPGDELFAGTINADDVIEATVLRPAKESSVQKILDLVMHAKEGRQDVQRAIEEAEAAVSNPHGGNDERNAKHPPLEIAGGNRPAPRQRRTGGRHLARATGSTGGRHTAHRRCARVLVSCTRSKPSPYRVRRFKSSWSRPA